MGFGFNLFFVFILLPFFALLTLVLIISWLSTKQKFYRKVLVLMWLTISGLIASLITIEWLTAKKELNKKDYYGQYIINRDYFSGRQTDWQYDHFRFEIKDNDSIFFYMTDQGKTLKTFRGTIK